MNVDRSDDCLFACRILHLFICMGNVVVGAVAAVDHSVCPMFSVFRCCASLSFFRYSFVYLSYVHHYYIFFLFIFLLKQPNVFLVAGENRIQHAAQ